MLPELRARFDASRVHIAFAVVAALTINPAALSAQSPPSITAGPTMVGAGGTITVAVTNGPGHTNDWVGLVETSGPDTSYIAWMFLNGTTSAPATGLTSATLQFVAPMTAGTYTVRLFANGWTRLATSNPVTVAMATPSVTVPASVFPGGVITATVANTPGRNTDWVGLVEANAPDTGYVAFQYLNGLTSPPVMGMTSATLQFVAPMTPGTYNVRLFTGGWTRLATSGPVTVQTQPSLTINDAIVAEGNSGTTPATFTVTLSPASANTVTVNYSTANTTATAGSDYTAANGTLTFAPGIVTRSVSVLVAGDTTSEPNEAFVLTLSSPTNAILSDTQGAATIVNDDAAPSPTVTVLTPTVSPGGTINVAVANGPGMRNDWVALAATGAPDTAYVAWLYLNGSSTLPPTGVTSATLQFVAPMIPGTYVARFFTNGWTKIASSSSVTVQTASPTVTMMTPTVNAGGTITVAVANGPGMRNDWVALAATGAPDSTYVAWKYLNGLTSLPAAGLTGATLQFVAPTTSGTYVARLFTNGWTKLATSSATTVADTTPPVISGVTAVSITSSGATINWTTNEAGDSQVDYGLTTAYGSTSPLNGSRVTTHAVILGALSGSTTYHFRVRSRDAAGNLALSGDFAFTTPAVDLTRPVVSITSPAPNAIVSGTTTFSASATDNVAVAGVEFKLDGVLLAPEDTAAPYTVAWDTRTASAGLHTLTAVAWDAAGNSATATRTVTVANALVQVTLTWNPNPETNLAGYRVYVGTSSGVYTTLNVDVSNVTSYTVTGLAPGHTYYFAVSAYDLNGLESGLSNEVFAIK
jgi:hypothetical protein